MTDTANQTKLAEFIHVDTPKRNSLAKTGRTLSRIFDAILVRAVLSAAIPISFTVWLCPGRLIFAEPNAHGARPQEN
jgi:hypothetical protein